MLRRDDIAFAVVLLLEVGDNRLQEDDHPFALRLRRRAPLIAAGALVRDLEFEAGQRGGVVIRARFGDILMRDNIPVVLGANRHARSFWRASRASLGYRVADLPQVGSDLRFLPFAPVVIPLVTSPDLHAGISLSLV